MFPIFPIEMAMWMACSLWHVPYELWPFGIPWVLHPLVICDIAIEDCFANDVPIENRHSIAM
jgi:hypothetical protein